MPADAPTIVATSGGMKPGRRSRVAFAPLVEHAVELSGTTGRPKLVHLGTASGDQRWWNAELDEAAANAGWDLRHLNLEDLLGRQRIELDQTAIRNSIAGKRVLVTGAGGSIGSELCRQIDRYGPAKLVLLDRDESAMHAAQMSMTGRALLDDGTLALCDIRDPDALRVIVPAP